MIVYEEKGAFLLIILVWNIVSGVHFNACNKCLGVLPYRLFTNNEWFVSRTLVPRHMREIRSTLLDLKRKVTRELRIFENTYLDENPSFLNLMEITERPSCLSRHPRVTDPRMMFFEKLSTLALYLDFIQTNRHRHECDVHVTRLCANDLLCKWQQVLSGLELFKLYPRPCCRQVYNDSHITSCTHLRTIVYLMLRKSGEIITGLESDVQSYLNAIGNYE